MHSTTRRKVFLGGAAVLSLVLMITLFVSTAAITVAQEVLHDKIAVSKTAVKTKIKEGDAAIFVIALTTQPFQIDGVVLTDVLPLGGPWTVSGDGSLATPNCNGVYAGGAHLTCNFGTIF